MDNGAYNLRLCRSLAWLSPSVFFHPLWVNYPVNTNLDLRKLISGLHSQAQSLAANGDFMAAGQIYLLCAAIWKQAGDFSSSKAEVQTAWSLGQRHHLGQVSVWSAWGSSSLAAHTGDIRQTLADLDSLIEVLRNSGVWTLANIVWLARQYYAEPEQAEKKPGIVVDWLLRWGESPLRIAARYLEGQTQRVNGAHQGPSNRSRSSTSNWWQRAWGFIRRIVRGELRLGWIDQTQNSSETPMTMPANELSLLIEPMPLPSRVINPLPDGEITAAQTQALASNLVLPGFHETHLEAGLTPPNEVLPQAISGKTTVPRSIEESPADLSVSLLGPCRVYYEDKPIDNWPSLRGCSIFKYLLIHRNIPTPREVLMEIFWPEYDPESARNNLNVAIYGLRQAFRAVTDIPVVLYQDMTYQLNPEISIWIDLEEFERCVHEGRKLESQNILSAAIRLYETAASLYQNDFMIDDPYEDWAIRTRERLRVNYLDTLDRLSHIYFNQQHYSACVHLCRQILDRDNCREDAHRRLMRCFSRQDQPHLALRQYRVCIEALRNELDVPAAPATTQLYEQIRRREPV